MKNAIRPAINAPRMRQPTAAPASAAVLIPELAAGRVVAVLDAEEPLLVLAEELVCDTFVLSRAANGTYETKTTGDADAPATLVVVVTVVGCTAIADPEAS